MAKKLGNDYRCWIESSTPGTYNEIKGQTSVKVSRKTAEVDTTSKDDFPYGTNLTGMKAITLDYEILPTLPDATGFGRLETLAAGSSPVNFQIRKGGSSGTGSDVVFQASMNIVGHDTEYPMNQPVKCTGQLTLAAAPTTDLLA